MSAEDPLAVVLLGARGRMGQAIIACAAREPERFQIFAALSRDDPTTEPIAAGNVVIDFSSPDALANVLRDCCNARTPLVIGTTGYDDAQRTQIHAAAREIPIVFASNFSVGVNTLFWLTREAARILGPGFDLEVIETHHRLKKDAPSGTARSLVDILVEARELQKTADIRHGRDGFVGARHATEIGVHAVRGGDVVGEHTVLFAGIGERLELTHRASSRETFAAGALRAARWLVGQPAALYDMEDVLGLRSRPAVEKPS